MPNNSFDLQHAIACEREIKNERKTLRIKFINLVKLFGLTDDETKEFLALVDTMIADGMTEESFINDLIQLIKPANQEGR